MTFEKVAWAESFGDDLCVAFAFYCYGFVKIGVEGGFGVRGDFGEVEFG